jgi:hypothetical protein
VPESKYSADVALFERPCRTDLASEKSLSQRAPRNEANTELFADQNHLRLGIARPQGVFTLNGGDGVYRVRPSNRRRVRLRQSEVFHFACLNQFSDRARHVLNGHIRITRC